MMLERLFWICFCILLLITYALPYMPKLNFQF
jgi:hypothetical protein